MHSPEVTLFDYMDKGRGNYPDNTGEVHPWDFKTTDGGPEYLYKTTTEHYRGMPFGMTNYETPLYVSARDVGNMGAGIVAAKNGIPYWAARIAFDWYQGGIEGLSSQNAEYYGWCATYLLSTPKSVLKNNINAVKHSDKLKFMIKQWIND